MHISFNEKNALINYTNFYLYFTKRSSIADGAFALKSRNPIDRLKYSTGSSILAFSSSSVAWVLILAIISKIIFGTAEINEIELMLEHFLQRNQLRYSWFLRLINESVYIQRYFVKILNDAINSFWFHYCPNIYPIKTSGKLAVIEHHSNVTFWIQIWSGWKWREIFYNILISFPPHVIWFIITYWRSTSNLNYFKTIIHIIFSLYPNL